MLLVCHTVLVWCVTVAGMMSRAMVGCQYWPSELSPTGLLMLISWGHLLSSVYERSLWVPVSLLYRMSISCSNDTPGLLEFSPFCMTLSLFPFASFLFVSFFDLHFCLHYCNTVLKLRIVYRLSHLSSPFAPVCHSAASRHICLLFSQLHGLGKCTDRARGHHQRHWGRRVFFCHAFLRLPRHYLGNLWMNQCVMCQMRCFLSYLLFTSLGFRCSRGPWRRASTAN